MRLEDIKTGDRVFFDDLWKESITPEPLLPLSEWSDANRVLAGEASAEPGPWRTSRAPFLREIMDCLGNTSSVERVTVVKGVQLGFTEVGLNLVGYCSHISPKPVMYILPTLDVAKRFSRTRVTPMIENSPAIQAKFPTEKSRDRAMTVLEKSFDHGALFIAGANAPAPLRSQPIAVVILDEVDAYPESAGDEGDPVDLAIKRTSNFPRRKQFLLSTPLLKDESRIWDEFEQGDQRFYNVPCDDCGAYSVIRWADIKWPKGQRHLAAWHCPHCGHRHDENRKFDLLEKGVWIATKEDAHPKRRSYHISSLYSPWMTWADAAEEHKAAGKNKQKLQVFTNTVLGETWDKSQESELEAEGIMARREDWPGQVPIGVGLLTAAVDVQDDRLECEVVGWGRDEQCWSLAYEVFPGSPGGLDVWNRLDRFLLTNMKREDGREFGILFTCVDTGGHFTTEAYAFCKARLARQVFATKGLNEQTGKRAPIWPKKPSFKNTGKVALYMVGTQAAKDTIHARLALEDKAEPGYCHFPKDRDSEYFEQLTAEGLVKTYKNGMPIRRWVCPPGKRNEALDLRVLNHAALQAAYTLGLKLNRLVDDLTGEPSSDTSQPKRRKRPRTRSSMGR